MPVFTHHSPTHHSPTHHSPLTYSPTHHSPGSLGQPLLLVLAQALVGALRDVAAALAGTVDDVEAAAAPTERADRVRDGRVDEAFQLLDDHVHVGDQAAQVLAGGADAKIAGQPPDGAQPFAQVVEALDHLEYGLQLVRDRLAQAV